MRAIKPVVLMLALVLPNAAQAQWLPNCTEAPGRAPVALWEPVFTELGMVTNEPPVGDGRIVYIYGSIPDSVLQCSSAAPDAIQQLAMPFSDSGQNDGGLFINIRGGIQPADGNCIISGYYMNEPTYSVQEGWAQTYYGIVDKQQLVLSAGFCLDTVLPQVTAPLSP